MYALRAEGKPFTHVRADVQPMTIELSVVHAVRKGWRSDAVVGPLNPIGVKYLNSSATEVLLTHDQLLHIDRHGGITDFDIITIPFGLAHGLFIGEKTSEPYCYILFVS